MAARERHIFHSITTRIIVFYCLLVILPFIVIAGLFFTFYWNNTLNRLGNEMSGTMAVTASSLQREMRKDENDSDIFYNNGLINQIPENGAMPPELQEQFSRELGSLCNTNSSLHAAYLVTDRVTLHGGGNYPEILDEMKKEEKTLAKAGGRCLWFPSKSAHGRADESRFIMARSLNGRTKKNIGYLYFVFNNQVITDLMSENHAEDTERILTDRAGTVLYSSGNEKNGVSADISMIPRDKKQFYVKVTRGTKKPYILASSQLYDYGWFCISRMDIREFNGGFIGGILPLFIIFLVGLLFLAVMIYILRRNVLLPVRKLKKAMDSYAQSDLAPTHLEPIGNDEFRSISGHFNEMTKRIHSLMEAYKAEEKEKNRQRLKTLSAQLTPHFVYNALNTIKWVAVLNHQDQIQHLTESLVTIFMNAARSDDEQYTLADELDLVESYAVIQRARFMNFDLEIDRGNVNASDLHFRKLLLQPIVENAIVHGLGRGRVKNGLIRIRIWSDERLHITVTDNGCGFDVKAWETHPEKRENHTNIGVRNVEQIIQLEFGPEYGMKIESEIGKGTCVSYELPVLKMTESRTEVKP